MSSFDQLIENRRSIRKYKPEIPLEEAIMKMIACAAMAPSPSNSQPVRFVRIQSKAIKVNLQKSLESGYQKFLGLLEGKKNIKPLRNRINVYKRFSDFIFSAPIIFAVGTIKDFSGFSKILNKAGILEEDLRAHTDLDISVGLALKGFILKGEAMGIGSCIVSAPLVFIENIESSLGLSDISVRCFVTVGYPDETPSHVEKKDPQEIYREI
jgi:nitroreductase